MCSRLIGDELAERLHVSRGWVLDQTRGRADPLPHDGTREQSLGARHSRGELLQEFDPITGTGLGVEKIDL